MKIYIDSDYKCYKEAADARTAVETEAFDGKCRAYIEGYRYIPSGESWTREDGEVFEGEAAFPRKSSEMLALAQSAYEESLAEMQDMEAALRLLEVEPTEEAADNG